jgi:hypothetical protein
MGAWRTHDLEIDCMHVFELNVTGWQPISRSTYTRLTQRTFHVTRLTFKKETKHHLKMNEGTE